MRIALLFAAVACIGFVWFATTQLIKYMDTKKENSNSSNTDETNSSTKTNKNEQS